ncbi:hypothetical protein C5F50_07240 [Nitrosopumilus ureiphilus]|uniref:Uncharacterized protein n=1 Tax=Nitrosopumilus ureiphilus TaxID=1470067 RepID=A0A7D5M882_9ARCH|nr:hypothetical protein C5F50_07240 [Nitrosopumilus ureiphilus]
MSSRISRNDWYESSISGALCLRDFSIFFDIDTDEFMPSLMSSNMKTWQTKMVDKFIECI